MHIEVPALKERGLNNISKFETSAEFSSRIEQARVFQLQRQGKANTALGSIEIEQYCPPDEAGMALHKTAISRLHLSARAYHRVLKVARAIADLAGSNAIIATHIAEALQYNSSES